MKNLCLIIFLVFLADSSMASDWKIGLDKDGIKVYTRSAINSSFKEFKGEVTIQATVAKVADAIMDVGSYAQWCYQINESKELKREGNSVLYYYVSEAPPIVKKREGYFVNQLISNELTGITTISMDIAQSTVPVPPDHVRLTVLKGSWVLQRITDNKTKVVFQMLAEPGGSIPAWLSNLVVVESPYVTLKGLRQQVSK